MRRILYLLITLLISTNFIFIQFTFGSSPLKLIEKGEYIDAEVKITKELTKTPDDIESNYYMSLLLQKHGYQKYNLEKSYEYLMKSIHLLENVKEERELKKLNKIPINQTILQNYTDTIYNFALVDAILKQNVETYQRFLDFFQNAPDNYKTKVVENRDMEAFKIASEQNTPESYDLFINKYPNAVQNTDAIAKRNMAAYKRARNIDKIESLKEFVVTYPNSNEVTLAWNRIHELAFNLAEKENTSTSFKKFIDDYPYSKQYSQALQAYEKRQYVETVTQDDWNYYRFFLEKFPKNSMVSVAQDSIYSKAIKTENLEILKYCVDKFNGTKRENALLLYHDIFTIDGEKQTLDMFYEKYPNEYLLDQMKQKDYEIANLGIALNLQMPYKSTDFPKYDQYIRVAAPREKAFAALQKMISSDIDSKSYQAAINKILTYLSFFGTKNKKLIDLISFLENK